MIKIPKNLVYQILTLLIDSEVKIVQSFNIKIEDYKKNLALFSKTNK